MSAYHAEVSTNVLGAVQGAIDVRVGQVSAWTVDGLPAIRQEQSLPRRTASNALAALRSRSAI
jgi:hypothetical protein